MTTIAIIKNTIKRNCLYFWWFNKYKVLEVQNHKECEKENFILALIYFS